MSELKLKRADVIKLIDMYHQKECLWNNYCSDYKKFDIKQRAWEKLAKEFNTTAELVKKKIKFLRTVFTAEMKKVDYSNRLEPRWETYIPTLFYYDKMLFLKGTIVSKDKDKDPIENPCSENSFECSTYKTQPVAISSNLASSLTTNKPKESDPLPVPVSVPSAKKLKISPKAKYEEALEAIIASTKEPIAGNYDMFAAFGNSVGMQLKQLPIHDAARIMSDIQRLLSDAFVYHSAASASAPPSPQQNPSSYYHANSDHSKRSQDGPQTECANTPDINLGIVKMESCE